MKRKSKAARPKPKSKVAIARADLSIVELTDLLVAVWETQGAPVGNAVIREFARDRITALAALDTHRACAAIRKLLEPRDERDPTGVKELYREFTSREYHGAVKEKPAPSVGKDTKEARRRDLLRPECWDGQEIKNKVQRLLHARATSLAKTRQRHGVETGATTREGRKIVSCANKWVSEDNKLVRSSFAGGDKGGLRHWDQVEPLIDAWVGYIAVWFDGELSALVKEAKILLIAERPARGKTVRKNGKVVRVKRRGRPQKPLKRRGPYGKRSVIITPPGLTTAPSFSLVTEKLPTTQ